MVMKVDPYRKIVKGLLFLGLSGLFFAVEVASPLRPPLSRKSPRVAPLRGHLHIEPLLPAVAEASDENDAYGDGCCLLGPLFDNLDPRDTTFSAEREDFRCANHSDLSFPISRSPPVSVLSL